MKDLADEDTSLRSACRLRLVQEKEIEGPQAAGASGYRSVLPEFARAERGNREPEAAEHCEGKALAVRALKATSADSSASGYRAPSSGARRKSPRNARSVEGFLIPAETAPAGCLSPSRAVKRHERTVPTVLPRAGRPFSARRRTRREELASGTASSSTSLALTLATTRNGSGLNPHRWRKSLEFCAIRLKSSHPTRTGHSPLRSDGSSRSSHEHDENRVLAISSHAPREDSLASSVFKDVVTSVP